MPKMIFTSTAFFCFLPFIASAQKPTPPETNIPPKLANLVRVTSVPHKMRPAAATLCLPATPGPRGHESLVQSPEAVIHVYVSPAGQAAMNARDATPFPAGTVILKQKFADSKARQVVLYTGMLKQPRGYNPACGDWEFFTLSADAQTVTSRGRIESCMACHKNYAATDFVTKQYPVER